MESMDFYYDGEYSVDHGIYLIKIDNDFIRDPFLGERNIITEKVIGNDIPYLLNVDTSPLEIKLVLSPLEGFWTYEKRREIARWLDKNDFREFYSCDKVDKRYYLLYKGGIDLKTNGVQQGYIEVEFQNISPYAYSPVYVEEHDFSEIVSPTAFEFDNQGDAILRPEIEIKKIGLGDVTITNTTNGNKVFGFTNLADQEIVYCDNENRQIITNLQDMYRYDSMIGDYLELVRGRNTLIVEGACQITIRYQFVIKG